MQEVLLSVSIIIVIATCLAVCARVIRQPPIIAYLLAGIIVGPLVLNILGTGEEGELIQLFAHLGVAFLLYIVGLHLDVRVFKEIGKVALTVGTIEIALCGSAGFALALALGFPSTTALYLGAALAFSSTVVVVKILSDKKEIDTLHGRIALGILIVEDIVATLALITLPLLEHGNNLAFISQKIGLLFSLTLVVLIGAAFINKKMLDFLARSQEALFLFGIAWALLLATLFDALGFSLEIGALLAGMSLAASQYATEIANKMKPLRDFFVVLFFVFFGSQLTTAITLPLLKQALLFSVLIVIGKPLIIMTLLRINGFTNRTNFLASSSLAQISEFSLILLLLGYTLGHIPQEIMSLGVVIALITISTSSYSMYYAHALFKRITPLLNTFEGTKKEKAQVPQKEYDFILFGSHRLGHKFLNPAQDLKLKTLIIENNPKAVLSLEARGFETLFGDAGEKELLEELPLLKAKLIISTIPDMHVNITIKEILEAQNYKGTFIATAEQPYFALELYKAGVDYVIIPHHLGGDLMASVMKAFKTESGKYKKLGKEHALELLKGKEKSTYE